MGDLVTIEQLEVMLRALPQRTEAADFVRVVRAAATAFGSAVDAAPAAPVIAMAKAVDATAPVVDQNPIKKPAARRAKATAAPSQPRPGTFTDAEVDLIAARWAEGLTISEIGDELGRGFRSIENKITRQRQKDDPRFPPRAREMRVPAGVVAAEPAEPPAPGLPLAVPAAMPAPTPDAVEHVSAPPGGILGALATMDDSFTPDDDLRLVEMRFKGKGFADIAEALGCDEDTAKGRWRGILRCGVPSTGGIVTERGWAALRAAMAQRTRAAAEATE